MVAWFGLMMSIRRLWVRRSNCSREIQHTREDFIEILAVIDDYESYCRDHKEYKNNRAVCAIENIKRVYMDRLQKHDFL